MIGHWKNMILLILAVSVIFLQNAMYTDAGVIDFMKFPDVPLTDMTNTAADPPTMARIFYSAIGDLAEAVPVFPITLNVPDMLTAFGGMMSGMYNFVTGNKNPEGSEPKNVIGAMLRVYEQLTLNEDTVDYEVVE